MGGAGGKRMGLHSPGDDSIKKSETPKTKESDRMPGPCRRSQGLGAGRRGAQVGLGGVWGRGAG